MLLNPSEVGAMRFNCFARGCKGCYEVQPKKGPLKARKGGRLDAQRKAERRTPKRTSSLGSLASALEKPPNFSGTTRVVFPESSKIRKTREVSWGSSKVVRTELIACRSRACSRWPQPQLRTQDGVLETLTQCSRVLVNASYWNLHWSMFHPA